MIGVGYRPRIGSVFFTRNGKKLDDVAHGLKSQNFFPTVGANGPCTIHVNFGQSGFVFIEANVKKWGLAPMTGSLAPPPPYGSEQGSILLEAGRDSLQASHVGFGGSGHSRTRSGYARSAPPHSPGPIRSPTDISLAHLVHIPSHEDVGEGASHDLDLRIEPVSQATIGNDHLGVVDYSAPPPDYSSPQVSDIDSRSDDSGERRLSNDPASPRPPIPSYDAAVGNDLGRNDSYSHG